MQAQDDERWSQQVADLHADGEAGQRFLEFFTFWFDAAEKMLDEEKDRIYPKSVIEHVRAALELAEAQFGYLSCDLLGAMLTVASMHWACGAEMAEGLTSIERRVMEEALARKIAALQQSATQDRSG